MPVISGELRRLIFEVLDERKNGVRKSSQLELKIHRVRLGIATPEGWGPLSQGRAAVGVPLNARNELLSAAWTGSSGGGTPRGGRVLPESSN
jgi:hypothetical protein